MNKWKRFTAGALSLVMVMSLIGCGTETTELVSETASADASDLNAAGVDLESTAISFLKSHGSDEGKEETVYILADADGNVQQKIVSAWLKNPEEDATIRDVSDLSDIENVKGDETYTESGDGTLTWAADGNDIYYQGTSNDALPIDTTVTYELDGKTVTASQLAGATGHLKITFTYKNNISKTEVIDGEKVTLYQPFLVVSGLMVDSEKASNIEVTNGKVINSDSRNIIVGMAMPGLSESLGLDTMKDADGKVLDIDVPEEVTVEADVVDFELLTTVTAYDNSALSKLNWDDVDDVDDLKDSVNDLTDAATQLVDGTSDLYDGVAELSDGVKELVSSTIELNDGMKELDTTLRTKMTAQEISDAKSTAIKAVDKEFADDSNSNSYNNIKKKAASTFYNTVASDANKKAASEQAVKAITEQSGTIATQVEQSVDASFNTEVATGVTKYDYVKSQAATQVGTFGDAVAKATASATASTSATVLSGVLAGSGLGLSEEQISALVSAYSSQMNNYTSAVVSGVEGSSTYTAGVDQLAGGVADSVKSAAKEGATGAASTIASTVASQVASSVVESVATSASETVGKSLADSVKEGAETAAASAAVTAAEETKSTIADGIEKIQSGSEYSLVSGMQALTDAVASSAGVDKSLAEGVSELLDGSEELKDGMSEFDEEGIQKITDLVEDDLVTLVDRIKALRDFSEEYNTFSGCAQDTDCSVKFIMRTDSIEAEEEEDQ